MVTVFEYKYPRAFVQLGDRNVEFLDHTFLTEDAEVTKLLKESNGFKNGKITVVQEVEDRAALEAQKKEAKKRGRPRIVSGATGTNN